MSAGETPVLYASTATLQTSMQAVALSWRMQLVVFFIGAILVVSRRPDALFYPQFFAEDGTIWFPQAYTLGWFSALFHSQDGYFQTLPRLAAALALLVPFRLAPLLENVIAIALQVAPANILLSERCRNWGPLSFRAAMAFVYIALPNSSEVNASMEEAQWHLALIAFLVIASYNYKSLAWRIFDVCIAIIAGLSGPFVVMLLPFAALFWWFRRESWRLVLFVILGICAAVQLTALTNVFMSGRPKMALGATPKLFIQLLGGHVYFGALLGQYGFIHKRMTALIILLVFATALVVYCFAKASLEWKCFLAFCFLVFAASLKYPMAPAPQWWNLEGTPGLRYWFFPTLAFAWVIVWGAFAIQQKYVRIGSRLALLAMCFGIMRDWRYPPFKDHHFERYAQQFDAAPPRTEIAIPITPDGWVMRINKKGSSR